MKKLFKSKTIILKVTHSCNLNCKYCCVGDVFEHQLISETTLDNLFRKLSEECEESNIIWHGGEPLLAGLPFYKRAIELQSKYPNHFFKNSIQTNGTLLTEEYLDFFQQNNFALGFSLDGCRTSHNLNRPFKGNLDSFDVTFKWMKEIERRGMKSGAICIINANTAKYIKEIYNFAKDQNIAFKFNAQYPAGRAATNSDLGLNALEMANAYIELFELWYNDAPNQRPNIRMFDSFVKNIKKITNGDNSAQGFDCAWGNRCQKQFIGVATNGDIYPCGKFVDEVDFRFGNINQNRSLSEILNNEIRQKFLLRHSEGVEDCKKCKYLPMCSSGCPHTSHLFTNNLLSKNPYCEAVLILFKHIEDRLVKEYKTKDIFVMPVNETRSNDFLVYSPLRGSCFILGQEAKNELEDYVNHGKRPINSKLCSHLDKWEHQLPMDVKDHNIDTYNKCVILLTQQCNLACKYCYAKNSRSNQMATKENIKAIIDRIINNRTKDSKTFSFIGGGEPTFDWELLKWSIEYIRLNQKHENVVISITTNGTLLSEERIVWLKQKKVGIGLSYDILPEIQNSQRPFNNGEGTFDRIHQTILLLHKHKMYFRIRTTISNEAVELMPQMVEFIKNNYPYITHLQLEPVQDSKQNNRSYYDKFVDNFVKAYHLGKNYGIDVYNMITLSLEMLKSQFCRGEFCLTPDGSIVACQRFSSDRDPLFYQFKYGEIKHGDVFINKQLYEKVEALYSSKLEDCETCFAKYHCAGICSAVRSDLPKEQLMEHCQFTKKLLKQFLLNNLK